MNIFKKFTFPWFARTGLFFYPASLPGIVIAVAAMSYLIYSFLRIDSLSHSASDTLRPFIIRCFIVYVAYLIIAIITGTSVKVKKGPEVK